VFLEDQSYHSRNHVNYEMSVPNGVKTNTVYWATGGLAKSEYEKANQLGELFVLIERIIYNHLEYKQLR